MAVHRSDSDRFHAHHDYTMSDYFDEDGCGGRAWHYDPNYYHTWVEIAEYLAETIKSYQVLYKGYKVWVPKKIIRKKLENRMFVHYPTFQKSVSRAVEEKIRASAEGIKWIDC